MRLLRRYRSPIVNITALLVEIASIWAYWSIRNCTLYRTPLNAGAPPCTNQHFSSPLAHKVVPLLCCETENKNRTRKKKWDHSITPIGLPALRSAIKTKRWLAVSGENGIWILKRFSIALQSEITGPLDERLVSTENSKPITAGQTSVKEKFSQYLLMVAPWN